MSLVWGDQTLPSIFTEQMREFTISNPLSKPVPGMFIKFTFSMTFMKFNANFFYSFREKYGASTGTVAQIYLGASCVIARKIFMLVAGRLHFSVGGHQIRQSSSCTWKFCNENHGVATRDNSLGSRCNDASTDLQLILCKHYR